MQVHIIKTLQAAFDAETIALVFIIIIKKMLSCVYFGSAVHQFLA